jgi:parallel beta-helix repeat protein
LWNDSAGVGSEIYVGGGVPTITYCDIQGGWEGNGNLDVNPRFRNYAAGDFHLRATDCGFPNNSPCIDAGHPTIEDSLLDCSWGLGTISSDIGAYGGGILTIAGSIQEAIDLSSNGDTVLIQPWTYYENINFNGRNIVLGSLFLTTGDTSYISSTIIDGADSGTVVTFNSGEDSTAVIAGFTIRHGQAQYGGGVYCGNGSNPTIANNIITMNSANTQGRGAGISCVNSDPLVLNNAIIQNYVNSFSSDRGFGGGIYCFNSNMKIIGNRINDNIAMNFGTPWGAVVINDGGGIFSDSSSPRISGNEIIDNSAGHGGGIYSRNSSPVITNNNISDNSVGGGYDQWFWGSGGGVLCESSTVDISANRITGNDSYIRGGGISFYDSDGKMSANELVGNEATTAGGIYLSNSDINIINNTLSGNSDGGIYCADNSSPAITNTILWADSGDTWQEIPGTGNISADPLFRDPDNSDFHLMSTVCGDSADSPCIDTGDPFILDSLLDCSWGLGTVLSDMGAYGGGDSVDVGIEEQLSPIPRSFALFQNYPNPFNPATTIKYDLPIASDVTIEIYDILGRKAKTLIQEKQQAGYHSIVWNAYGFSSGMYFYRIQAGDYIETKKMLLLK